MREGIGGHYLRAALHMNTIIAQCPEPLLDMTVPSDTTYLGKTHSKKDLIYSSWDMSGETFCHKCLSSYVQFMGAAIDGEGRAVLGHVMDRFTPTMSYH